VNTNVIATPAPGSRTRRTAINIALIALVAAITIFVCAAIEVAVGTSVERSSGSNSADYSSSQISEGERFVALKWREEAVKWTAKPAKCKAKDTTCTITP